MASDPVHVEVVGEESVIAQLGGYERKAKAALESVIANYTKKVYQTARELTEGEGSGRTYSRPWGTHQASKEGEPPAEDTGRLRATIRMTLKKAAGVIVGKVLAGGKLGVDYATILEFPPNARPFMKPALMEHVDDFVADVKKALSAAAL